MSPEQFAAICETVRKMWHTTLRGGLRDFDEYQSRVLEAWIQNGRGETVRALCLSALRDLRRERDRDADVAAHLAFEAQRPAANDVLPSGFVVPSKKWGGARPNSGGRRPGAGRKPRLRAV